MNGQPAQTPVWQIHETPEKRVYYYNPVTKVTRWDKPEELMDPMDVCVSSCRAFSVSLCLLFRAYSLVSLNEADRNSARS
jgi:hypothetical protein